RPRSPRRRPGAASDGRERGRRRRAAPRHRVGGGRPRATRPRPAGRARAPGTRPGRGGAGSPIGGRRPRPRDLTGPGPVRGQPIRPPPPTWRAPVSFFDDDSYLRQDVADCDPEVARILRAEAERQAETLEMIASENFTSHAVLQATGSVLTNKYAEGYPGRRYYGGREVVDQAERLAIERAKAVFGAEHVNVQSHAGATA